MRLLYVKPELRDLSQGSRIAFVRQLRHLSQDYVSCSPFRVPLARLASAQAAINNGDRK